MTPERLSVQLKEVLGEKLISVLIYGSAAANDQTRGLSDTNLLLVLADTHLETLNQLQPLLQTWVQRGNSFPALFTLEQIQESVDVFPIEFLDIQDARRVIAGTDPFTGITIHPKNLRHQVEFELRGKLMQFRRRYLEAGADPKKVAEILARALSPLGVLFRATLRLVGETAPPKRQDAWTVLAAKVPLDVDALNQINTIREKKTPLSKQETFDLFGRFMASLEAVIKFINKHEN